MADGSHKVAVATTGNDVDVSLVSNGVLNVERQRVVLAGDSAFGATLSPVSAEPLAGAYALPVRPLLPASMVAAFGALRVASEECAVAMSFAYGINTDLATTITANGGTATATAPDNLVTLDSGTNTAGAAAIESKDAVRYVPGQGVIARFTAIFSSPTALSQQEVGWGDATDGFFVGYNGSTLGVCRRRAGVDTWVPRSQWADRLDGSGPSGIQLDPTKLNVFEISVQYLGGGGIVFLVEEPGTARFHPFYVLSYANANVQTSILNPTLPMRAAVKNAGNNTSVTVKTASLGGYRDGPTPRVSRPRAASARRGPFTTEVPILTLQNKTTFNSRTNRARIRLIHCSASSEAGNADLWLRFVLGATLTGANFTDWGTTTSCAATDSTASAMTNGANSQLIHAKNVGSGSQIDQVMRDLDIRLHPGETLTVSGQTSGSNQTARVNLTWVEEF